MKIRRGQVCITCWWSFFIHPFFEGSCGSSKQNQCHSDMCFTVIWVPPPPPSPQHTSPGICIPQWMEHITLKLCSRACPIEISNGIGTELYELSERLPLRVTEYTHIHKNTMPVSRLYYLRSVRIAFGETRYYWGKDINGKTGHGWGDRNTWSTLLNWCVFKQNSK